jgi:ankyrin repeat protein
MKRYTMLCSDYFSSSASTSSLFVVLALLIVSVTGCGPSQEEARNQLREAGFSYDEESFHDAVQGEGNPRAIKRFLQAGMTPDVRFEDGSTPLIEAAKYGHDRRAEILLEYGADPNLKEESGGDTPLIHASREGHTKSVKTLIEYDANLNTQNEAGESPLLEAIYGGGHFEVVKSLVDAGADLSLKKENGYAPLIGTGEEGHARIAEFLLEQGANPNIQEDKGLTALWLAAQNGHREVISVLLEAGADPSLAGKTGTNVAGMTPLWVASDRGHSGIVKDLVTAGADPNRSDSNGNTPLMEATEDISPQTTVVLLKNGARPRQLGRERKHSAMVSSAIAGDKEAVQTLIDAGVDPNITSPDYGSTAFTSVIQRNRKSESDILEATNTLLECGADPNVKDDESNISAYGWTPLIHAANRGYPEVTKTLLENGADASIKGEDVGETALVNAAEDGNTETIKVLLNHGGDPKSQSIREALYGAYEEDKNVIRKKLP